jgi:hypothetical protein
MDETTINPVALPPRRELFAQPSARAVWAGICALDVSLQWEVLRELQVRLAAPDLLPNARVARCVLALKEAADNLGRSPGAQDYEELRTGEFRAAGWPSAHTVRRVLAGDWNHCLSRAALDAVADGHAVVIELGSAFTEQEVIDALQACRNELDRVPSLTEYLGWACTPEVKRRAGRRPLSQGPFDRLFGGYLNALGAAGLCDLESGTWNGQRSTVARGGAYRNTDETMRDALREVADRLERSPTTTEYVAERELIKKESMDAGRLRVIPSYQAIHRRFGGWTNALAEAGLEPVDGRRLRTERPELQGRPSKRRIPNDQIRAAIREAYVDVGDPFTADAYKAWQKQKVAASSGTRTGQRYPSYHTIWSRHGSWDAATRDAFRSANEDNTDEQAPEPEVDAL